MRGDHIPGTALHPIREVRAFLRAALWQPVPRDHRESSTALRRRRVVCGLTLLVGGALLGWSLSLEPGDPTFYLGTLALAAVWAGGALVSGRLYLGRAHRRRAFLDGRDPQEEAAYSSPVLQAFVLGLLLLALFLAGALVVAQIPLLAGPVEDLLDHARYGSLPLVLAITMINGVAEELFFRGALYAAIPQRWTVAATTVVYALVTATSGVPLLVLAALLLGLVCGLQRRVTGGILGPVVTHITWSTGMLLLLPPLMEALR